jgi:glycosyltransferase involved in cell wall biosynthesis
MRIAMLLHKSIEHDSRVRREARALAEAGHEVMVLHLPRAPGGLEGEFDGFGVRSVTPPAWVRERLPTIVYRAVFLLSFVGALCRIRPDAVHAHDAAMLLPGSIGAWITGSRLVYDSHEYAAGVPYRDRGWAFAITLLERIVVPRCDAVITVSDGIAERLRLRYRLAKKPVVVRNLPDPSEVDDEFDPPDLRGQLGIGTEASLVMHLGAVARDRGCESLILALGDVSDAHLLFLGADDDGYAAGLRDLTASRGLEDRVHFRRSVPVPQVRAYARQADVGISLLEGTCENHRLALPNKVFEYAAAGVPVVVSDHQELRALIVDGVDGRTVDPSRPEDVAGAIRAILSREDAPGDGAPQPMLSWKLESERLITVYR